MEAFKATQDAISAELVATTRTAGQLAAEDLGFLRTSDRKAAKKLDRQNARLLDIAQRLIGSAAAGSAVAAPEIKKPERIDENWRGIVDVVDNLLERADRCLDEYTGVIKRLSQEREETSQQGIATNSRRESKAPRSHPLSKPQLLFQNVPKNNETACFRPLLTQKPHALVPLEDSIRPVLDETGFEAYQHPYSREITESKYPASVYIKTEPIPSNDDPEGNTLTWVDTPEQVVAMLEELKKAKEIAVDLEHHDQHSYVGLVCLMQISTREKDWIVDTLRPWRQDLQVLNEVFADPAILKVFHGSTMDMIWLQRDLGLYVVGLFDTYHATNALMYRKHSLAFLLKQFEDFDAQKQYQMADWRTRPLTKEMMHYARADTHYLLHIYDNLRNELVEHSTSAADGNFIDYVLQRSKAEALQRYERSFYDAERGTGPNGWLFPLIRTPALFSKQQFAVFKAVHQFRDKIARQTDESLIGVMRNDTVFTLARSMPDDMPGLLGCIHPVSPFLQSKLSELLALIKKAKREGETGPEMGGFMQQPEILKLRERYGMTRAEKQAKRKAEQAIARAAATPTLAQVIQAERAKAAEVAGGAVQSAFWGLTLGTAAVVAESAVITQNNLRLVVPVPDLSAEVVVANETPPTQQAVLELSSSSKPTQNETVFSIKQLKQHDRKRKANNQLQERPNKQAVISSPSTGAEQSLSSEMSTSDPDSEAESGIESESESGEDGESRSAGKEDTAELDEGNSKDGQIVEDTDVAMASVHQLNNYPNKISEGVDHVELDIGVLPALKLGRKKTKAGKKQEGRDGKGPKVSDGLTREGKQEKVNKGDKEKRGKHRRREKKMALAQQMSDSEFARLKDMSKSKRRKASEEQPNLRTVFLAKEELASEEQRKRQRVISHGQNQRYDQSQHGEDSDRQNEAYREKSVAKSEARSAARAKKRAKKAAENQARYQAVPFDYAQAPSVLNAPAQNGGGGKTGKNGKNKIFDPYARALETSKGVPKRKQTGQGKSKTFQS